MAMCSVRKKVRQNLNSEFSSSCMKLCNEDVQHIIKRWQKGLPTKLLAKQFGVCQRRIQELVRDFKKTGQFSKLSRSGRRPYAQHPKDIEEMVCELHLSRKVGANYLAKFLRDKYDLKIANGKVHAVLRKNKLWQWSR